MSQEISNSQRITQPDSMPRQAEFEPVAFEAALAAAPFQDEALKFGSDTPSDVENRKIITAMAEAASESVLANHENLLLARELTGRFAVAATTGQKPKTDDQSATSSATRTAADIRREVLAIRNTEPKPAAAIVTPVPADKPAAPEAPSHNFTPEIIDQLLTKYPFMTRSSLPKGYTEFGPQNNFPGEKSLVSDEGMPLTAVDDVNLLARMDSLWKNRLGSDRADFAGLDASESVTLADPVEASTDPHAQTTWNGQTIDGEAIKLVCYDTATRNAKGEANQFNYLDANGKPTVFGYRLALPASQAEALFAAIEADPTLAREIGDNMMAQQVGFDAWEQSRPPYDDWATVNGGISRLATRRGFSTAAANSQIHEFDDNFDLASLRQAALASTATIALSPYVPFPHTLARATEAAHVLKEADDYTPEYIEDMLTNTVYATHLWYDYPLPGQSGGRGEDIVLVKQGIVQTKDEVRRDEHGGIYNYDRRLYEINTPLDRKDVEGLNSVKASEIVTLDPTPLIVNGVQKLIIGYVSNTRGIYDNHEYRLNGDPGRLGAAYNWRLALDPDDAYDLLDAIREKPSLVREIADKMLSIEMDDDQADNFRPDFEAWKAINGGVNRIALREDPDVPADQSEVLEF